jgi:hypothetical protein
MAWRPITIMDIVMLLKNLVSQVRNLYDGIIWYGDKVSEAVSQFNAACGNGWVPGIR